ncbi:HNH endonuclease [Vibrio metschnikovii]|uniref:HNH endonuclease n=1 Tax=Vibrio metschnikovii TaxID=28172 RepID=UPI001C3064F9|nr:HNH endonuclease [Vibrio metschnikovii]
MKLVESLEELQANISELERIRTSGSKSEREEFLSLIKKGTCFVPYIFAGSLYFAPSRFVGYIDNSLEKHKKNSNKDGRVTNKAIDQVLDTVASSNSSLESAYVSYCSSLGFIANEKGSFGAARKYWRTTDVDEFLDSIIENEINKDPSLTNTEKEQLIKSRIGQGKFRESLIKYWKKCSITGCGKVDILRASHIKPWKDSNHNERLDVFNGLLLTPNLDALFDKGLISFDKFGGIIVSKDLTKVDLNALGISKSIKIDLAQEHEKYMSWHRENIYCSG